MSLPARYNPTGKSFFHSPFLSSPPRRNTRKIRSSDFDFVSSKGVGILFPFEETRKEDGILRWNITITWMDRSISTKRILSSFHPTISTIRQSLREVGVARSLSTTVSMPIAANFGAIPSRVSPLPSLFPPFISPSPQKEEICLTRRTRERASHARQFENEQWGRVPIEVAGVGRKRSSSNSDLRRFLFVSPLSPFSRNNFRPRTFILALPLLPRARRNFEGE